MTLASVLALITSASAMLGIGTISSVPMTATSQIN